MTPIEKLKAVLCDPEGKCCIQGSDGDKQLIDEALAALKQQPAEHIVHSNGLYSPLLTRMMNSRNESNIKQVIELYDNPDQQPAAREPLTDAKIVSIFHGVPDDFGALFSISFARAIEAAHGITAPQQKDTP